MPIKARFISADDHVIERPEVWSERLSNQRWGDRIPHLERQADGSDCWLVDRVKYGLVGEGSVGALQADRSAQPTTWDAVPPAAYLPTQRLAVLDAGGIDYSVLYPTISGIAGQTFSTIRDPELELDCVKAYNDWLIEEWSGVSPRFIAQCIVPLSSIEAAVSEIKRAVGKGHRGVIVPPVPHQVRALPHLNDAAYEPIWRICEQLGVPVCFHAGGSPELQMPPYRGYSPALAAAFEAIARPAGAVPLVSNLIVSRLLERFPTLKVVFAESSLGWIGFALEAADYEFDQFGVSRQIPYELKPSEAFRRQCYAVTWYGQASLRRACQFPGANNILWAANLPLASSTWPDSLSQADRSLAGFADEVRDRVLWRNAAELYRLF